MAEDDRLELEYRTHNDDDDDGARHLVTNEREWDKAKDEIERHCGAESTLTFDLVEVEGDHVSWEIRTVDRFKELDDEEVDNRSITSRRSRSSEHSRSSRHGSRAPPPNQFVPWHDSATAALAPESNSNFTRAASPAPASTVSSSPVEQKPDMERPFAKVNTSSFFHDDQVPLVVSPTFTHNAGPPSTRSTSPPLPFRPMDFGVGFDEKTPEMGAAKEQARHRDRQQPERERDHPQEHDRRPNVDLRSLPADEPLRDSYRRSGGHRSQARHPPFARDEEGAFRQPGHRINSPRFSPPTGVSPQSAQTVQSSRISVPELLQQIETALDADKTIFYTIKGVLSDWQERRMEKKTSKSAHSSSVKGPSSVTSSNTNRPSSRLRGRQSKIGAVIPAVLPDNKHGFHTDTSCDEKRISPGADKIAPVSPQRTDGTQKPSTAFDDRDISPEPKILLPSSSIPNSASLKSENLSRAHRPVSQQKFSSPNVLRASRDTSRFLSNGGVNQSHRSRNMDGPLRHTWHVTDTDDNDDYRRTFTAMRKRRLSPPPSTASRTRNANGSAGGVRAGGPSRDILGFAMQEPGGRLGTEFGFFDFDDFPR